MRNSLFGNSLQECPPNKEDAMAKKKRRMTMEAPTMPSPTERRKWAAESLARTIVETAPGRKKELDYITDEVMKAGARAEHSARHGRKKTESYD